MQAATSPLGVTFLYSVAFLVLLIITVTRLDKDNGGVPMTDVALFSSKGHAQYIYGFAALLAVRARAAVLALRVCVGVRLAQCWCWRSCWRWRLLWRQCVS